jgi:hypothetical protein
MELLEPRTRAWMTPDSEERTCRLVMYWRSVLASANPLCEGRRFVRPFRKDAGRHVGGRCNGVF